MILALKILAFISLTAFGVFQASEEDSPTELFACLTSTLTYAIAITLIFLL